MRIIESILLGLVQGLTEYFPVSSTGHLALLSVVSDYLELDLDFSFQTTSFDVILHLATFLALVIVYRHQIWVLITARDAESNKLRKNVLLTSTPILLVGGIAYLTGIEALQADWLNAIALILVGLLLIALDLAPGKVIPFFDKFPGYSYRGDTDIKSLTSSRALFIGVFQMFAVIRGVSRSGITIVAGILQGMSRKEALDYSFIASIPLLAILSTVELFNLASNSERLTYEFAEITIAFSVALISAYIAIILFRGFIERKFVLAGFGLYRVILGLITLVILAR